MRTPCLLRQHLEDIKNKISEVFEKKGKFIEEGLTKEDCDGLVTFAKGLSDPLEGTPLSPIPPVKL